MSIPRIYTEQSLTPGSRVLLESESSHHLTQVLRLQRESKIRLFNGSGREFNACIMATEKRQVQLEVLSQSDKELEPQLAIQLGIGISKGERMDYAIQKSVELGVGAITPLFSQHGVVNLKGERLQKRQQHWHQVMISACEQSGRCRLPAMHDSIELEKLLEKPAYGLNLVLNHRAETNLVEFDPPEDGINLLVGPEGGLSEAEILAAQNTGFHGVRLGPRVLRTETAPLAAIAAIQTLWGDFRYS